MSVLGTLVRGQPTTAPKQPTIGQAFFASASFSADGKTVLTDSGVWPSMSHPPAGKALLWDTESGSQLRQFVGHTEGVNWAVFSPDNKFIATAGGTSHGELGGPLDCTARIWDSATGKEIRRLVGHTSYVVSVQFSADGKQLLSVGHDATARLWDVATGHQLLLLGEDWIQSASFSPDGHAILGVCDAKVVVWDNPGGKEMCRLVVPGVKNSLFNSAEFNSEGKEIVTSSSDMTARIWDAATGKQVQLLAGHKNEVVQAHFSADSASVVTIGKDGSVRLWNAGNGKEMQNLAHAGMVLDGLLSSDGKRIITRWVPADMSDPAYIAGISLWDAQTGKEIRRLTTHKQNQWPGPAIFTPDGKSILIRLGTVQLWDADTGKTIREYK